MVLPILALLVGPSLVDKVQATWREQGATTQEVVELSGQVHQESGWRPGIDSFLCKVYPDNCAKGLSPIHTANSRAILAACRMRRRIHLQR